MLVSWLFSLCALAAPAYLHATIDLAEGGTLAYCERPAPGPKLLLIPGSFNDYRAYDETVAALSPAFHLIIMDLRGHGASWPPAEAPSIELFAQDALRVADALELNRFYIGGHSIGGMIAIEVARHRPAALAGIISIEGWTHHTVLSNAFQGLGNDLMTPEQVREHEMQRERVLSRLTDEQRQVFGQAWKQWDGWPILEETQAPVLEIWGDRGKGPFSRALMRIPDRPNITLCWVPGAGHSLPVQAPVRVADMINEFITRLEAPPP